MSDDDTNVIEVREMPGERAVLLQHLPEKYAERFKQADIKIVRELCELHSNGTIANRPPRTRPADELPDEAKTWLVGRIGTVLLPSAFARRSRWGTCVIVLRPEGDRVTSRGDFIGFLLSADLRGAANECRVRKVPPGHVLVWLEADHETVAVAGFLLFDLRKAVAEL